MTVHTIALVTALLWLVTFGVCLGLPTPPKREWTTERRIAFALRFASEVFIVWLLITVLL